MKTGSRVPPVAAALTLAFLIGVGHGVYDRWRAPAIVTVKKSDADVESITRKIDLAARRKALAGAWVVPNGEAGGYASDYTQPMAIQIDEKSDQVTIWDGRAQSTARLVFDGPCAVSLMRPDPDGGEGGPTFAFTVHDGVAELGVESAGERVGDGAIFCSGFIYVLDGDGECALASGFDHKDGGLDPHPRAARCGFREDAGKTVFYTQDLINKDEKEETVPVDGWRIGRPDERDPSDPNRAAFHRYDNFVAARAVVDNDARANDPALIAKDAGGTVGETSTVAGLVASYAADREKLDGKVVRVTGVVAQDGSYDRHVLAAPGHDKPTVTCDALDSLALGAPAIVEGKVEAGFDTTWTKRPFAAPGLGDCKLITP